jgi:hypothetical protein
MVELMLTRLRYVLFLETCQHFRQAETELKELAIIVEGS